MTENHSTGRAATRLRVGPAIPSSSDCSVLFALVGGSTATARIEGISAAGATPDLAAHTPSADLEIVSQGRPVAAPIVPVSPSGCPTPAIVTRSVRELVGFELLAVNAGLARPTAVSTETVAAAPGGDVRSAESLPAAEDIFETARDLGASLSTDELFVGESIPGGTTTALAVLAALGERETVSSSLAANPLELKRRVVADALRSSDLSRGETAGDPTRTLRLVGDPVLAAVAGLTIGATSRGIDVTLAGGTQLAAAAALVRHAGVDAPLTLATTAFIADDETAGIDELAADFELSVTVSDPGFDRHEHPAFDAYVAGEAKEGAGMGGALALADRADVSGADLRERIVCIYDRLLETESEAEP